MVFRFRLCPAPVQRVFVKSMEEKFHYLFYFIFLFLGKHIFSYTPVYKWNTHAHTHTYTNTHTHARTHIRTRTTYGHLTRSYASIMCKSFHTVIAFGPVANLLDFFLFFKRFIESYCRAQYNSRGQRSKNRHRHVQCARARTRFFLPSPYPRRNLHARLFQA